MKPTRIGPDGPNCAEAGPITMARPSIAAASVAIRRNKRADIGLPLLRSGRPVQAWSGFTAQFALLRTLMILGPGPLVQLKGDTRSNLFCDFPTGGDING